MRTPIDFFIFIMGLFFLIAVLRLLFPIVLLGLLIYSSFKVIFGLEEAHKRKEEDRIREENRRIQIEAEKERARKLSIYNKLLRTIQQAILLNEERLNYGVIENLKNSQTYLLELKKVDYENHKQVLNNMLIALESYNKFLSQEIKTEEVREVIDKVEESIPNFEYALKTMYLETINEDLMDTDVQIDVLNSQLKADGLSPSDFE